MKKAGLIAGAIALAAIVIWGGLELKQKIRCDEMHEDFLNAFSAQRNARVLEELGGEDVPR